MTVDEDERREDLEMSPEADSFAVACHLCERRRMIDVPPDADRKRAVLLLHRHLEVQHPGELGWLERHGQKPRRHGNLLRYD